MIVHYTKINYKINQSFQQDCNAHIISQLHAFACLMPTSLAFFCNLSLAYSLHCIIQLSNSGTAYNVTLNLTGHILMGIGISLALLLYLFQNAMNDASSSSSGSHGYAKRYLQRYKVSTLQKLLYFSNIITLISVPNLP